ncbi:hypothetical protein ACFX2J_014384 [Malus domestica]
MSKIAAAASEASNFVKAWQEVRYATSLHPPHFSRSLSSEPLLESGLDEAQECEGSITVLYLVNSCGFSAEKALTLSEKVSFETTERPYFVLGLLRDHGFANSEISKLVSKVPRLLLADPEKILLPKLEFLRSLGLSGASIALAICRNPIFLTASLKNALVPGFNLFKKELLSDEKVMNLITRSWGVLSDRVQSNIAQNLSVLRALEVP